jgi:hypothetical protein
MNKFFTVLLAGLFVFAAAVPASATDARLASLAYGGNYLEDDYNIFTWYGTLPSYSNMVWIGMQDLEWDEGDEMFYFMGASYGLGEDGKYGTLAMFYYDYAPGLNPFGYSDGMWPGAGLFGYWLPSKFTMMYGYAMEKMSLGLYFSRADEMAKYTEDEESAEYKHAYTTFGAGLRFDLGEKAYMDVAADLSLASYKEEETSYGDINQDANKMYGFRARMFYEWNETITWVPYFNFRMFDFNLKADEEGFDYYGDKGMFLDFGLGANIKVNEDNLLLFAIEPYSYAKREPSDLPSGVSADLTMKVMPRFILGLESDVKDWLTFRAGAKKELTNWKMSYEETGEGKASVEYTYAPFDFYMGLGFHVGDFDIDLLLNNEVPMHLGYWLTGYQQGDYYEGYNNELPIYMITATYGF